MNNTKIQIVSRNIPVENIIGNSTYILSFLRYLRLSGCEIEYTLLTSSPNGKIPWYIIPSYLSEIINLSVKDNLRFGRLLLRFNSISDWLAAPIWVIFRLLPKKIKKRLKKLQNSSSVSSSDIPLATPDEIAFTNSEIVRCQPDVVIANYTWLANIFNSLIEQNKPILRVILTHDILHERVASFQTIGATADVANWTWDNEAAELRKAQVLLAIQEQDAKTLKIMAPQCDVITMPMAADSRPCNYTQIQGRCLFVGSDSPHNVQGLQWFLEKLWNLILQQVPHASLHVCGTVAEKIKGQFHNVKFLGRVDDLNLEYGETEVCLVPLQAGSGLKIKLVEALSYGRACVATSIGAQGLEVNLAQGVIVTDAVDDFATSVCQILTNSELRLHMEAQARAYITKELSPKTVYQRFVDRVHQHTQPSQILCEPHSKH